MLFRSLLPLVDVFLPNELEACGASGEIDPRAAAAALQSISGGWIVVKLGAEGRRILTVKSVGYRFEPEVT